MSKKSSTFAPAFEKEAPSAEKEAVFLTHKRSPKPR